MPTTNRAFLIANHLLRLDGTLSSRWTTSIVKPLLNSSNVESLLITISKNVHLGPDHLLQPQTEKISCHQGRRSPHRVLFSRNVLVDWMGESGHAFRWWVRNLVVTHCTLAFGCYAHTASKGKMVKANTLEGKYIVATSRSNKYVDYSTKAAVSFLLTSIWCLLISILFSGPQTLLITQRITRSSNYSCSRPAVSKAIIWGILYLGFNSRFCKLCLKADRIT